MLDNLKFVQRAIGGTKALDPELRHYRISSGRITAFNGRLALSAPVDLDMEAFPNADMFFKAISACKDSVAIHITETKRLAIRSGRFKAFVPCLDDVGYAAGPEGEVFDVPDNFIKAIETIYPFVSEDASRPWSMGALLKEGSILATNNVTLVQYWLGHSFPPTNLPRFTLAELLRVKEAPEKIQISDHSATFHYSGDRWFRTQLMPPEWPFDKVETLLGVDVNMKPLPDGFADAVETLTPFFEGKASAVYFVDEGLCTETEAANDGVHIKVPGLPDGPIFSIHQLKLVCAVASKVDFSLFPNPAIFIGDNLRGAAVGMR